MNNVERNNMAAAIAQRGNISLAAAKKKMEEIAASNPEGFAKATSDFKEHYASKNITVPTTANAEGAKVSPGAFLWDKDDEGKAAGARWDADKRKWYHPEGDLPEGLKKWA